MTDVTDAERRGALIEAEFRTRARQVTGHAELLDYIETMAEVHGAAVTSAELAAIASWVFVADQPRIRPRLRLARIVLFGAGR